MYVLKKVCTKYVLSEQYYNDTTKCSFRPNLLALNFNQISVGFAKFVSSQIFIANFKCLLYIRVSIYACKNNYIQLNVTNKKQKWFEDINYFWSGSGITLHRQFCCLSKSAIFSHFESSWMFYTAHFEGFILDNPIEISIIKWCINIQLRK